MLIIQSNPQSSVFQGRFTVQYPQGFLRGPSILNTLHACCDVATLLQFHCHCAVIGRHFSWLVLCFKSKFEPKALEICLAVCSPNFKDERVTTFWVLSVPLSRLSTTQLPEHFLQTKDTLHVDVSEPKICV